jgi:hypothetical protein
VAAPAASGPIGWASVPRAGVDTTTGGGNADAVTVTTLGELNNAASGSAARVIKVSGAITAKSATSYGTFKVGSNKSILGLGGGNRSTPGRGTMPGMRASLLLALLPAAACSSTETNTFPGPPDSGSTQEAQADGADPCLNAPFPYISCEQTQFRCTSEGAFCMNRTITCCGQESRVGVYCQGGFWKAVCWDCLDCPEASAEAADAPDAPADASSCVDVGAGAPVLLGTASEDGEHTLTLPARSASHTSWAEPGNEALILEVRVAGALRGHLVMHQGADGFDYTMAVGHLNAGDAISVLVSPLSAKAATPSACVGPALLATASNSALAEGIARSPIIKWPPKKRFDDLPVVLGWSKARKGYQLVYTNENGGTVQLCGGGAKGIQAEIARWGRATDIEGIYSYNNGETWGRCTGSGNVADNPVTREGQHPIFYYGDGHNRLYESRGGYGQACGTKGDEKADGDIEGWNVNNPGNEPSKDGSLVLVLRPLPVSLDALGYDKLSGRREALADRGAPWVYRLLDSELQREGKLDQSQAFPMQQYAYADVYAADVGGSGDKYCTLLGVSGGFVLRVQAAGSTINGPQMTADYFGGQNAVKRIAVALPQVYKKDQFTGLIFDAYDDDGMYWLAIGDVFVPRPSGDNGATIELLHSGKTDINVYVDDDSSGCSGGMNQDGPAGPAKCVGGQASFGL